MIVSYFLGLAATHATFRHSVLITVYLFIQPFTETVSLITTTIWCIMELFDMVLFQSIHFIHKLPPQLSQNWRGGSFHLLAVMINRINRTIHCPLSYNGHLPVLHLIWEVLQSLTLREAFPKFTLWIMAITIKMNYTVSSLMTEC